MANIDRGFRIDVLSFSDLALAVSGTEQPDIGVGFEAPQGSIYLRQNTGTNGGLYVKFGPADVDWRNVSAIDLTFLQDEINNIETSGGYLNSDGTFDPTILNTFNNVSGLTETSTLLSALSQMDSAIVARGPLVNVQQDGIPVPNTPHNTVNFIDMEATDTGTGVSNIQNIFGSYFASTESLGVTTTTQTTPLEKLSLNTGTIPAGTYRIGWSFQWNHNATTNDFLGRVQLNNIKDLAFYQIEPKDAAGTFSTTGTNQQLGISGFSIEVLTAGTHIIDIDFTTSLAGVESSMWNTRLEFWRIS